MTMPLLSIVPSTAAPPIAPARMRLQIVLTDGVPGYNKLSGKEKEQLEKPGILKSNQPLSRKLNPTVESIQVNL